MVPLDGTEIREQALPIAAALAQACGASLRLLMVVPTLGTLSGPATTSRILLPATTQEMLTLASEDARKYVESLMARLSAQGITVNAEIRRGDAVELIASEAQSQGVDLIVLGTSALAGLDAFWSGSIAPKVSNRTHLPLLLVPVRESRKD